MITFVPGEIASAADVNANFAELAARPTVQAGTVQVSVQANTITPFSVTFPTAFKTAPTVTLAGFAGDPGTLEFSLTGSPSTTSFTGVVRRTTTSTAGISWIAVAS